MMRAGVIKNNSVLIIKGLVLISYKSFSRTGKLSYANGSMNGD